MATFTDGAGRQWSLRFDYNAIRRMRDAGFDLRSAPASVETEFSRLADDPILYIDVITAALEPELQAKGVAADHFKASLHGDEYDAASDAFLEATADFFPKLRPLIRAALGRLKTLQGEAVTELSTKLESGELDGFLQTVLSGQSGSTPASAAFTPAPSASAS